MILIIEDAALGRCSPPGSLLAFLVSQPARELHGLLIIASYRSDELHRTHPLRPHAG